MAFVMLSYLIKYSVRVTALYFWHTNFWDPRALGFTGSRVS